MNDYSLPEVLHAMVFLSDGIFSGLKILIPFLFLIQLIRVNNQSSPFKAATFAANTLLLSGGILFLITILFNTTKAWYSGNESERDFIISFATGPHWYQFVIPILNYGILPHMMWLVKLKKSVIASFVLVTWWIMSSLMISYLTNKNSGAPTFHPASKSFPFTEYVEKFIIFTFLFLLLYLIIRKKQKVILESTSTLKNEH